MTQKLNIARPRAYWLLLAAPALLATPTFAQETTPVAPPPVTATQAQTPPPAVVPTIKAAPAAQPAPAAPADSGSTASKTTLSPEAQAALDEPTPRAARPAPRATVPARPAPRAVAEKPAPAPVAAAPAPAPVAAPAPAPETAAPTAPAPEAAAPAPTADTSATETASTTTQQNQPGPIWPWALGGALIVAAVIGFLLFRRRRDALAEQYEAESYVYREPEAVAEPAYVEPVAAAPVPVEPAYVEPVVASDDVTPAAPTMPEDVTVSEAEAAEVAALTGEAPVNDRPWLEFAMRPVRAGTNVDEAMVEIELTVANAGSVAARDVRVSTFMLTEAHADEMERYLVDPPADAAVDPVTIEPGEGARIDATLAALKADLGVTDGFKPVVVADARYTLPDGSEGRTSASFVIGRADSRGKLLPFDLDERAMHDDVEVRLHGTPEHA